VAQLWAGSLLDVRLLGRPAGAASALKMAYATWTKASTAMLLAVRALARAEGVDDDLVGEWQISQPSTVGRAEGSAAAVAAKAWRFVGEMDEIAATFDDVGLPNGFAEAAKVVYARLAALGGDEAPDLGAVADRLLG